MNRHTTIGFSKSPTTQLVFPAIDVNVYSKTSYLETVNRYRREFIHGCFAHELKNLFEQLREDAQKMKTCKREFMVEVPEHVDIKKMVGILIAYFEDLGYKVLAESSEDQKIVMSIT